MWRNALSLVYIFLPELSELLPATGPAVEFSRTICTSSSLLSSLLTSTTSTTAGLVPSSSIPSASFLLVGQVLWKCWTTSSRLVEETLGGEGRRLCREKCEQQTRENFFSIKPEILWQSLASPSVDNLQRVRPPLHQPRASLLLSHCFLLRRILL